MNYFAHALPFLAAASAAQADTMLPAAYFMAGTASPIGSVVADRPLRVRSKHVEPFLADADRARRPWPAGCSSIFATTPVSTAPGRLPNCRWRLAVARDALSGDERASGPVSWAICWSKCCWTPRWRPRSGPAEALLSRPGAGRRPAGPRRRSTAWPRGHRASGGHDRSCFAGSGSCGITWKMPNCWDG